MGGEKIEITATGFGTAADEFDVRICKRNDPRDAKVFVQRALFDLIESNLSTEWTVAKIQLVMLAAARNGKRFFSEADNGRERGAALGLQPQKNASGFQDRRFSLPVPADKKIESRRKFDPERFEAAKISELQVSEHKEHTL